MGVYYEFQVKNGFVFAESKFSVTFAARKNS